MDWYYVDKGQQIGPLPEGEFDSAVQTGKVAPTTLVWHTGLADWQPYSAVTAQTVAYTPMAQTATNGAHVMTCMECGNDFAQTDMARYGDKWICARCKPIFIQKLKEGLRPGERLEYAGFWIRFGAKMLDSFALSAITMACQFVFGLAVADSLTNDSMLYPLLIGQQMFSLALSVGYNVYFVGKFGATPGKMACRIMVVSADGGSISYGRAFGRLCAELLSAVILGIGYLMAAWDSEKRTLHDRLCNTRVVRR